MQRKINRYWKREETSDETLSSVATKVQRTENNVTVQSSAISNPLPVNQDQVEEKCSTVYLLIWSEQQSKKTVGCTLLMAK